MTEVNIDPKVLSRLQGALNLAQHPGTGEAESAAAMARVQEICAAYNLSLADISSVKRDEQPGAKRQEEKVAKAAFYAFQRKLMRDIAEANYCHHWVARTIGDRGGKVYHHMLLGRETNVIACRLLFEYLEGTINRLATALYPNPLNWSREAVSWRDGCATRLGERLSEARANADREQAEKVEAARKEAEARAARSRHPASAGEPATGTALVLLSDVRQEENDLNWDKRFGDEPGTATRRRLQAERDRAERQAKLPELMENIRREEREAAEREAARRAGLTQTQRDAEDRKAAREQEKQDRANQRYWERQDRQAEREASRRDPSAFRAGMREGDKISLDKQIDEAAPAPKLTKRA